MSKKKKIVLVVGDNGDALFVNGKNVAENDTLYAYDVLSVLYEDLIVVSPDDPKEANRYFDEKGNYRKKVLPETLFEA